LALASTPFSAPNAAVYETEILKASGFDLEAIFHQGMQFLIHKESYQAFGDVGGSFVQASKKIVTIDSHLQLTSLIWRFFESRDSRFLL